MAALCVVQLWAAWSGANHYIGAIATVVLFFVTIGLRFTLPITIFAFFGAWVVWGWAWYWALLLALPSLAIALPSLAAGTFDWARSVVRR